MHSILLTGGSGFIGSHTCLKLLEKGFNVFNIDSNVNSSSDNLENVWKYYKSKYSKAKNNLFNFHGDIRNYNLLENIFIKARNIDREIIATIHFAGLKSIPDSIFKPVEYWDNNLSGTINLLKTMDKYGCKVIIFSSSATIYDPFDHSVIKESTKICPINPYGNTKVAIEKLLRDVYHSYPNKWKIINLRYFNPVGSYPKAQIGEKPKEGSTNLFPVLLKVAKGQQNQLSIYGNDWPTKDGTCIRDYIHVMDLVEGHIRSLDLLLSENSQFLNINLGTGIGSSVLEVVNTFQKINNVSIPYQFKKRRIGDIPFLVADINLALKLLCWSPIRSLDQICEDVWKFDQSIL